MPSTLKRFLERLSGLALLRTLPGQSFLVSAGLLVVLSFIQREDTLSGPVEMIRRAGAFVFLVSGVWLLVLAVARGRREFLWRVRRRLILSYVFLGVVPIILVGAFALAGSALLYMSVAAYVFTDGFSDAVAEVRQIAASSALELSREPALEQAALERKYTNSPGYPDLSLAVVPMAGRGSAGAVSAGAWRHAPPPSTGPAWMDRVQGFAGTLVMRRPGSDEARLVIRAAAPTSDGTRLVIADLPVDPAVATRILDRTGIGMGDLSVTGCGVATPPRESTTRGVSALFSETVAFMSCTRWDDGRTEIGAVSVELSAPVATFAARLGAARPTPGAATGGSAWTVFVYLLVLLGVLFLIVQGAAFVIGWVLVKSITSAVHELFVGTERVQQGDFSHRIRIESRDQLGDLASSFNRMSASMEHLLAVQREKQRLDEELRIAQEIQRSLLPVSPPKMAGLDVADLCEPAREVGGDYYDFFELGPRQLGVLIADVSGKGTSAALYMAELKGLMLALSQTERSPRQLLIDVNRRLADHLDNRSFITMTYVVLDMDRMTLTAARAGHTPLIVASRVGSRVIVPDGMVVGLRLPGAATRFEDLLVEHTQPLSPGDVIALYTDGITEAMNTAGDLFGDDALSRLVAGQRSLDAAGIRERIVRDVRAFVGDAEQHDDMTLVLIKVAEAAA